MPTKKKITILISIVVLITAAIIYFIIMPTVRDIEEISNSVRDERIDLEKKYLRGQLLRKTIENFEKIKPEQEKLASIFIVEEEELKFITTLEETAAKNQINQDIRLQSIGGMEKSKEKEFYPVPLSITTQGNFVKIMQYLNDLEHLNYYFNISSIIINSGGKSQGSGSLITMVLNGEVYVLPKER